MTWRQRHRLRSLVQSSLWIVPLGSMLLALGAAPLLRTLDATLAWRVLGFSPDGARSLLGALVAAGLSFIVFTFSILLVAVQIGSGQLSPRVISSLLRDPCTKAVLGVFVFAFTFSAAVLGRTDHSVHQLSMALAVGFSLVSIGAFLYLIDYQAKSLRPITVTARIAVMGQRVIESEYPRAYAEADGAPAMVEATDRRAPSRVITHRQASAVLLAVDFAGLVAAARDAGGVLEMVPQVGDFVAQGDPLFRVFGAETLGERALVEAMAFGPERTLQQDPAFAFRILVDIAAKALSPAINDPTTAVVAIDQIHWLLRLVGKRDLRAGHLRDGADHLRLIYRTPDWSDFVSLAVTEIRLYGSSSIQVSRRLRAMLENLVQVLPPDRRPALQAELNLLHHGVEREFRDREDVALAEEADPQGLGGARPLAGVASLPSPHPDKAPI